MPATPGWTARAFTTVVTGALAGGLTTQAALAPTTTSEAGMVAGPSAAIVVPAQLLAAPPLGQLRRQEAEISDELARRAVPTAASRSGPERGSFVRPARGAVSGVFGEPRGSGRHPGMDFDGDTGDGVLAAGAGTVALAGPAPAGYSGYGILVVLDHGGGVQTLYAHLSETTVRPGVAVLAGERIGAIGTTGVVTGSHLHFELRQGGVPVNPRGWLPGG